MWQREDRSSKHAFIPPLKRITGKRTFLLSSFFCVYRTAYVSIWLARIRFPQRRNRHSWKVVRLVARSGKHGLPAADRGAARVRGKVSSIGFPRDWCLRKLASTGSEEARVSLLRLFFAFVIRALCGRVVFVPSRRSASTAPEGTKPEKRRSCRSQPSAASHGRRILREQNVEKERHRT